MTIPVPPSRSGGLRMRVLGFPVRIGPSFLIVLAFLGYTQPLNVGHLVLWVVIGGLSILAHELGHALVARTTGAHPEIDLYGFGGLTRYQPPREPSRLRTIAITIAGPFVGIAIGLALHFGFPGDSVDPYSAAGYALRAAVFVNLGWGLLNLLPVLPLDGGQTLVELLPGSITTRLRAAAAVSVVVAGAGAGYALQRGLLWTAAIAAYFALSNFAALRSRPAPDRGAAAGPGDAGGPGLPPRFTEDDANALWLVDQGQLAQARHLVETTNTDLAVHGLVMALTGRPRVGHDAVVRAFQQAPGDPLRVSCLVRLLLAEGDHDSLATLLASPSGGAVPPDLRARVEAALGATGSATGP